MFRHPIFAAWFVSGYLLAYTVMLATGNKTLQAVAEVILLFSPLFVLWMAYSVIRYGRFSGKELEEGEEFGYSDRP
jgi:hypothetical protein